MKVGKFKICRAKTPVEGHEAEVLVLTWRIDSLVLFRLSMDEMKTTHFIGGSLLYSDQ